MTCQTGQVDDTSSGGPHQGQETLGDPDGAQPVDVHHGLVLGQRAPLRLCERRHARVVHHRPQLCSTQTQTKVSGLAFTTTHSSVQHRHRPRSVGFHHRPQLCSTETQTKVSGLSPPPTALFNTDTEQGQRAFTTTHSSVQHRHRPRSAGCHHHPQLCSTQTQTKVSGLSPPPTALFNTDTDQGQRAFTTAHSSVQHSHRPRSVDFHHRPQLCSTQPQTKVSGLSPPPIALFNTGTDQGQWDFIFQRKQ